MTIPQAFQTALQHHQSGRLSDAEALYRQILAAQPNHADALHLLGVIAHQVGRHDVAVDWIRQAIVIHPNDPFAHGNLGEAFRAMGRLVEAESAYRRALELKPDYPEARGNLGAALAGAGRLEEAEAELRCALELKPGYPEALSNLGITLRRQGRFDESIAAYRQALELKPCHSEAHHNLGIALRECGQLDEAIASHRRALELKPGYPEAHQHLGIALRERGRLDEAIAACGQALALQPDSSEVLINLAAALAMQGRLDEAIAACRRALHLRPDYPEAFNYLGLALAGQGQFDDAIAASRRALELKPDYHEALNNLGVALTGQKRLDEAIATFRHALQIKPDAAGIHSNLGNALRDRGDLDEAIGEYRQALQVAPNDARIHSNLGNTLRDRGDFSEAIALYRRALQLNPADANTHSNLVFTLHFDPNSDTVKIAGEHQRWNRQFGDVRQRSVLPHGNSRHAERRLRVGYVSPDFREHPAGRYALSLFEHHDHEKFEVFCYSGVAQPDWITERFRALAGGWRDTFGVPDARLAEIIREDAVDILVDLAMHTAGSRLPMFALRPAPVQVTWLAYPGSTGLPAIGYRLTDAYMDPPGDRPAWSAEEPVRLPDCWCCYGPIGESPEINVLPALSAKGVTFGSLNSFAKVNDRVLALWARVLNAVEGSRLLMICPEGQTRERVLAFFGARGIAAPRVEFASSVARWEYLALYQRIDLGLDPYPCNGMTTTCDALWMGVPVLTLPGEMPTSRAGLSLLSNIGLGEMAASSEDDYLRSAVELAGDLPHLAHLRATLRERMLASPLMDAPRFAQNVEAAYRSMWRRWCAGQACVQKE